MWWYPCDGAIIACNRPAEIHKDEQGRLHNESGPAVMFRDGWTVHYVHGVSVPAHWVENRTALNPREVISHDNVEVRAIGAALVGWPKMLGALNARTINDSGCPDIGELIELDLPGLRQPGRFLKALCPRNGLIVEGLPRVDDFGAPIETALHGQAWRVGMHLSEYRHPEVRT